MALERLGETIEGIVFGPKTEGVVEAIKPDSSTPGFWHVLVRTDQGELRHFTHHDGSQLVTQKGKLPRVEYIDHSKEFKTGDKYVIRTRGTGFVNGLLSHVDKDPFNLQPKTP